MPVTADDAGSATFQDRLVDETALDTFDTVLQDLDELRRRLEVRLVVRIGEQPVEGLETLRRRASNVQGPIVVQTLVALREQPLSPPGAVLIDRPAEATAELHSAAPGTRLPDLRAVLWMLFQDGWQHLIRMQPFEQLDDLQAVLPGFPARVETLSLRGQ